jgi:hypothetical protein
MPLLPLSTGCKSRILIYKCEATLAHYVTAVMFIEASADAFQNHSMHATPLADRQCQATDCAVVQIAVSIEAIGFF